MPPPPPRPCQRRKGAGEESSLGGLWLSGPVMDNVPPEEVSPFCSLCRIVGEAVSLSLSAVTGLSASSSSARLEPPGPERKNKQATDRRRKDGTCVLVRAFSRFSPWSGAGFRPAAGAASSRLLRVSLGHSRVCPQLPSSSVRTLAWGKLCPGRPHDAGTVLSSSAAQVCPSHKPPLPATPKLRPLDILQVLRGQHI